MTIRNEIEEPLGESFLRRQRRVLERELVAKERNLSAILADVSRIEGSTGRVSSPDGGDQSLQITEWVHADALEQLVLFHMKEIEAAMQRLDNGSYGRCMDCDQPIEQARLEALPEATVCTTCKATQTRSLSSRR